MTLRPLTPLGLLLLFAAARVVTGIAMAIFQEPRKHAPLPTRSVSNSLGQTVTYIPSMRDFDAWLAANRNTKIISIAFQHHIGGAYVVHEYIPEAKP